MSSSGNSPNHRFSGTADTFYDPEFTVDISKRMRVPDRIQVVENGFDDPAIIAAKKQSYASDDKLNWMHVPDRILVMGNDSHIASREPLPELKLENSMLGDANSLEPLIQLETPPRTITLNEHKYPSIDDNNDSQVSSNAPNNNKMNANKKNRNIALSNVNEDVVVVGNSTKDVQHSQDYQSFYASNVSISDMNDETALLRRQVMNLSKRIAAIEVENQNRHQREVIIYTFGVIYFLIKGLYWFQRHV